MMTIKELLTETTTLLRPITETPNLEADLLLCFVLNKPRHYLYSYAEQSLNESLIIEYRQLIAQRQSGVPMAYLTHHKEFWSLPFAVNAHTLIPRPETELLIEQVLLLFSPEKKINVLELGTGSGAIVIALAKERPTWSFTAIEYDSIALNTAISNANINHVHTIQWIQSDWYTALNKEQCFDLIISNPPYLSSTDPHLPDLTYEPYTALVSGPTGLECFSSIIKDAVFYLKPTGLLILEHGATQQEALQALLTHYQFHHTQTYKDLQNHPRVTSASFVQYYVAAI